MRSNNKNRFEFIKNDESGLPFIKKIVAHETLPIYKKIKGEKKRNIPYIKDIYEENGKTYVIREYIHGQTLEEYICEKGKLKEGEACNILFDICDALEYLHSKGIIHRDVKPANIIISKSGEATLIDLDIARFKKADVLCDTVMFGTIGFAAPEQYGYEQTDATADIYSMGIVFNYMLTGKFINEEKYMGRFAPVIDKCTRLDPRGRYKDIQELKKAVTKADKKIMYFYDDIRTMPGFRSGSKLKAFIASSVYIFSMFVCSMSSALVIQKGTFNGIWVAFFKGIFQILIPFLIAADYKSFQEKIPYIKNFNVYIRRSIFIFASLLIFAWTYYILDNVLGTGFISLEALENITNE